MDDPYSSSTALLYIFNLIVGAGALTLPKAFFDAGWILSSALIIVLAMFSYITATFIIEGIALCSSIMQWKEVEKIKSVNRKIRSAAEAGMSSEDDIGEIREDALMLPQEYIDCFPSEPQRLFTLDRKIELGEMASLLFSRVGQFFFYIFLCLYLYGDLTIYSAAISKTIVDTSCTINNVNATMNDFCWISYNFRRQSVYNISLGVLFFTFGPFVFFSVQKTKYLQFLTSFSRWLAFSLMIGLSINRLSNNEVQHGSPIQYNFAGFPALLGSCIYSFMCHHSLPGLIYPINNKAKLKRWLAFDYLAILLLYLTLALLAVFAFPKLDDLFTLNFAPDKSNHNFIQEVFSYFLTLFPVFTFTTSFPIICVTLRSNLNALFGRWHWKYLHSLVIPVLAVVPPILLAMATDQIEKIVGITGSFAGVIVQYIVPASIVLIARSSVPPPLKNIANPHASPFKTSFWPLLVIVWGFVCIIFAIVNITMNKDIE